MCDSRQRARKQVSAQSAVILSSCRGNGFTLVETLVAVLILTCVLSAIYGAFRAGTQSRTVIEEHTDLYETARILFARIGSELDGLCRPSGSDSIALIGKSSESAGNTLGTDVLEFTTTSHTQCSDASIRGDVCTVTYAAKKSKDGSPVGLFISEDFYPDLHGTDTDPDLPVAILSDLVVSMDFSYLNSDTEEWVSEWVDQTNPPEAVRIKLVLRQPRKEARPVTFTDVISLPRWLDTSDTTTSTTSAT